MTIGRGGAAILEICADSDAGVAAAIEGGADRIELCGALELGGLTPTAGLVEAAMERCAAAGVRLHAMIRPRAGDFTYDRADLDLAVREARSIVGQGVDGLVLGACAGGGIDRDTTERWVGEVQAMVARPLALTFHRAIDLLDDPVAAVEAVVALGFDRILTSGGATTALAGAATIRAMVARAGDALAIIAGAGVRPDTAAAILAATGVGELHGSASAAIGPAEARVAAMGFAIAPRRRTDTAVVRALKNILDNQSNIRH